jgi:two-component system chemotaxis sensor kinase CheA
MRSGRFLDLYITETREHLQLLTRSILALERGESAAIEEAFRAAHTIKGLAAAMGHRTAATRIWRTVCLRPSTTSRRRSKRR